MSPSSPSGGSLEAASGITVAGLAASGGALLQGIHVPAPDARIAAVEIYDAIRAPELGAGTLLLGVGLDPRSAEAARLVERMAEAGVAAVAFAGTPEEVLNAVPDAGTAVALFAVTPGAGWAQVHTVVRTLTTAGPAARELATPYQDLFAIANAVAAHVGGPTTIEDAESRLLAFSSPQDPVDDRRLETILGRAIPDEYQRGMQQAGVFRQLIETGEPILLDADEGEGMRARLAIAVKAGAELLGYLWVSEGDRPLDDQAALALKELTPVVALHLLRVMAAGSAELNRRRDLVTAALDGAWSGDQAVELDLRRGEQMVVACLAPDGGDGDAEATYLGERACQIVEVHFSTFRVRGMATRRGTRVYCILPSAPGEATTYQRDLVDELLDKLAVSLRVPFRAGIGSPVRAHALRQCRVDAEAALRTSQLLRTAERTVAIDEVRDRALLVSLRDVAQLHPLLDRGSIAKMQEYDREHGGSYTASLRAYLDCQCSIPAAARALHIHANTLRYRLVKLTEIFGLDLDDPHERLSLSMQLWLNTQSEEDGK